MASFDWLETPAVSALLILASAIVVIFGAAYWNRVARPKYLLPAVALFFVTGWSATSGQKSQLVRLIDVVIYGPVLIYIGIKLSISSPYMFGSLLIAMGVTTIAYNLKNYLDESSKG